MRIVGVDPQLPRHDREIQAKELGGRTKLALTVDAKTGSPFVYSGKTGVLNGVAYAIRANINL
jgi:hypothetical protein